MTKATRKLSRFAKRHYEAIAEAMQEAAPDSGKRYTIKRECTLSVCLPTRSLVTTDNSAVIASLSAASPVQT